MAGVLRDKDPGDDLLSHADAHYHRRGCVSLPSSGWDRVVPQRFCHQGEGGGSPTVFRSLHRDVQALAEGSAYSSATLSRGGRRVNERLEQAINVLRPRVAGFCAGMRIKPKQLEVIWSSHTDH